MSSKSDITRELGKRARGKQSCKQDKQRVHCCTRSAETRQSSEIRRRDADQELSESSLFHLLLLLTLFLIKRLAWPSLNIMRDLNLDVLELIFAHLSSGNDLASVALVSRSFFAGVVARLYANILFRISQSKRYSTASPRRSCLLSYTLDALKHRSSRPLPLF